MTDLVVATADQGGAHPQPRVLLAAAPNFPDVPATVETTGHWWHKGVWGGFAAPEGLSQEIAAQYETMIRKVCDSAEFNEDNGKALKSLGLAKQVNEAELAKRNPPPLSRSKRSPDIALCASGLLTEPIRLSARMRLAVVAPVSLGRRIVGAEVGAEHGHGPLARLLDCLARLHRLGRLHRLTQLCRFAGDSAC